MLFALINFLLYGSVLYVNWRNNKHLNCYTYLLLVWACSAFLGFYLMWGNLQGYKLALWPFLYLFVVFLLFIHPFKSFNVRINSLSIADSKWLELIAWIYVVTGILTIIFTLPTAIANYASADWDALKDEIYLDEDLVVVYHNAFEKLVMNIRSYIETFAIVYAFYLLTKQKSNKLLCVLILITYFGNTFVGSVLEAGRGRIARILLDTGLLYIVFRPYIEKRTKKILKLSFLMLLAFVSTYLIAVTVSRFGEGSDGGASVIDYLGHSTLNFNFGIAQHIQNYAGGKRFFSWFYDLVGLDSYYGDLRHRAGHGFVTFIGNFYMDFGAFGTLLLSFIMLPIISYFTSKKSYHFSDLVVIVFFAQYYLDGVFVYGAGTSLQWLMTFVLYFIIRFFESKRKSNINYARN